MKWITKLFIALYIPLCAFTGDPEIIKVRNLYYKASADKDEADKFYDYLKTPPSINSSLLSGYSGMSYMIKANYSWNPYNKLNFFLKGKDLLDNAITKDPANAELRFLRYCVQTNAPGFLSYSGKIKEDKVIILYSYPLLKDSDLKERIKNYMNNPKYCTDQEINSLK